jgi:hypothetical protein
MNAQNIIPLPNKMELQTGKFNLSASTKIYYGPTTEIILLFALR